MTLASEAKELAETLRSIVDGLENYNVDSRKEHTTKKASQMKPLVDSFYRSVTEEKSKEAAKLQLDEIKELMHVKGDPITNLNTGTSRGGRSLPTQPDAFTTPRQISGRFRYWAV